MTQARSSASSHVDQQDLFGSLEAFTFMTLLPVHYLAFTATVMGISTLSTDFKGALLRLHFLAFRIVTDIQ